MTKRLRSVMNEPDLGLLVIMYDCSKLNVFEQMRPFARCQNPDEGLVLTPIRTRLKF
jgi:hypothetical protein